MNDNDASITGKPARRPPWNKGKIIGPKPPLRQGVNRRAKLTPVWG